MAVDMVSCPECGLMAEVPAGPGSRQPRGRSNFFTFSACSVTGF